MTTRVLVRMLTVVLLGAACGVASACVVVVVRGPSGGALAWSGAGSGAGSGSVAAPENRAREVLRAWDAARAEAWRAGDPTALALLYTPASVAGARDVAMLDAWNDRGRRVTRLTTQVLRLRVLAERPDRLVLVVTDRLARAEAGAVTLPHDRSDIRRIVLRRTGGGVWRVASVLSATGRS